MAREVEHLKGLDLIVEERLRQVEQLGYTIPHDSDEHSVEELMRVGACYIDWATQEMEGDDPQSSHGVCHAFWPETSIPWKPEDSAIENAAKGAAFVAAALDLLYAEIVGEV